MGKIVKNIEELVGHTPLFEFVKYKENNNIKAHILGKLEYFNPSGSVKDRAALNMIKAAALYAATQVAKRPENEGKNIVAILADNGMKYLSTNMYPLDKRVQ